MTAIHIVFSRFSAFYAPLIVAFTKPFLAEEGFEPTWGTLPAGKSAVDLLRRGEAQVAQSAVSQGFLALERGDTPTVRHFAQINRTDGFFLVGREEEPEFAWSRLAGRRVLVDHGGQPRAMFRYACHRSGLDYAAIDAVDAGDPASMERAFRDGEGDYIHLQGPAPQGMAADGAGHAVAAVGRAVGRCAFSSLAATPEWLATAEAEAFMRAYRKARGFVAGAPVAEAAAAIAPCFDGVDAAVLRATVADYRDLGCWTGGVDIDAEAWRAAEDVFLHAGVLSRRHDRFAACVSPPGQGRCASARRPKRS